MNHKVKVRNFNSAYWDKVARQMSGASHYLDRLVGDQKREKHLSLIRNWLAHGGKGVTLKTDLFEEAFGSDHFLSFLQEKSKQTIGMDISPVVVGRAKRHMDKASPKKTDYLVCDIRVLPFLDGSIDFLVSSSTLDHFSSKAEIVVSIEEFSRCLKVKGLLIITMDNGENIFDPLIRLIERIKLSPYHMGPTVTIGQLASLLTSAGFAVTDKTPLIHNPRIITTLAARAMRVLFPRQAESWIKSMLAFFDRMNHKPLKYKTGCFIAVRAVKQHQLLTLD